MKSYKTKGIILKRRNLGEADRILTVLSMEEGKIQVKAPGVRHIISRRSSHVEPLNFSELTLYRGSRTFFPIVTEAQTIENFSIIKSDLKKIGYAYYICELINSLCAENQENKGIFFLTKSTLSALSQNLDAKSIIKYFEKELLGLLGFWAEVKLLETYDSREVIENILEKRLKTLRVLPLFTS